MSEEVPSKGKVHKRKCHFNAELQSEFKFIKLQPPNEESDTVFCSV